MVEWDEKPPAEIASQGLRGTAMWNIVRSDGDGSEKGRGVTLPGGWYGT